MPRSARRPADSPSTSSAAAGAPLPPEVIHKTKHHVIDTIAAMVSGAQLPPGKRGLAYVADADGPSVLVGGRRAVPVEAALANGMSAHADETDDSHARSISHPGCAVVPAALAVGDLRRSTGEQVLRAVAAGYDVGTRVVLSLGKPVLNTESSGRSTHAYCGLFGAAATASTLYGFDEEQVRHALSYAAQSASGVTSWVRDPNHVEKAFVFAGMPASNGVRAAAMVASGCDGVDDVFSGVPNFLDALSTDVRRDELADGLGERYEIMHTNIKKFAVGSPAQAAVQAMLELVEEEPIDPAQVTNIRIVLPHDLARVVDDRSMPDINCQYLVAGTLVDRAFTFAMAHDDDRMTDPVITALRSRSDAGARPREGRRPHCRRHRHPARRTYAPTLRRRRARHGGRSDDRRGGHRQSRRPDRTGARHRCHRGADGPAVVTGHLRRHHRDHRPADRRCAHGGPVMTIDLTELAGEALAVADRVDGPVRAEAVRGLLNVVGTTIGAAATAEADIVAAGMRRTGAPGDVPVPGRADTFDPPSAALLTGFAAHLDDFDDTHLATVVHPGAATLGAALGASWLRDRTGDELLRAFAVGIELQLRVAVAMSPSHYDAGWHITGTVGPLGAATAAAMLMGLDAETIGHALGVASSMTIGHREGFGTMNKPLHPGKAAANGLVAATAASHGLTASPSALDGPRGYFRVLAPEVDLAKLLDGWGRRWELLDNTYKPYPCGIVSHPAIEAAEALHQAVGRSRGRARRRALSSAGGRADRQPRPRRRVGGPVLHRARRRVRRSGRPGRPQVLRRRPCPLRCR